MRLQNQSQPTIVSENTEHTPNVGATRASGLCGEKCGRNRRDKGENEPSRHLRNPGNSRNARQRNGICGMDDDRCPR